MNKKEISEIRKLMTPEHTVFTSIRGCYVTADSHEKISKTKAAFLSLPESEECKYLEICKKALAGKLDKTLYNLSFPLEQEQEDGAQNLLYRLRECRLQDDELVEQFYDSVIESYQFDGNYYIILLHGVYDVPGRMSEGEDPEVSEDVFPFIQCCICPVTMSDARLGYLANKNRIGDRARDWVVEMPETGFLFPLFSDRASDIHGTLFYCKNEKGLTNGLIEHLLQCENPIPPTAQKNLFASVVEEAFGDNCSLETVMDVHECLEELELEDEIGDNQKVSEEKLKKILKSCGADNDALENIVLDNAELSISNITEKAWKVKTDSTTVQVRADARIREAMVDGERCLIIPLDGEVEVNGIPVRLKR